MNKYIVVGDDEEADTNEYMYKEEPFDPLTTSLQPLQVCVKIVCCTVPATTNTTLLATHFNKNKCNRPLGREISGTVESVGERVTMCTPGEHVAGILPLDSTWSGCGMYCVLAEYDLVPKPDGVTHLNAACAIGDALRAYTALFYQAKVVSGETIVIASAACGTGVLTCQLARDCGLKVIVIGATDEEIAYLHSVDPPPNQVVDIRNKKHDLVSICLKETSGLGVDCFLDNGVSTHSVTKDFMDETLSKPSKYDIISCLGVGGRWVTMSHDLQLDPQDSKLLSLKSASLHFLFEDSWTLSRSAQGKFLHVLSDIMDKLSREVLQPTINHTLDLNECVEVLNNMDEVPQIGRILVKCD